MHPAIGELNGERSLNRAVKERAYFGMQELHSQIDPVRP
jgi:hypothetical protein